MSGWKLAFRAASRQRGHLAQKGGQVDGPGKKTAAFAGESLFRARNGSARGRHEEDVDLLALGELAHPRHDVERSLTVDVDEDDARSLYRCARHEHRKRNIDDGISARAEGPRHLFGFCGRITNEERRARAPARDTLVKRRARSQGSPSPSGAP